MPYSVEAGKIEQDEDGNTEFNCKYCDDFNSLAEAMNAAQSCLGYHYVWLKDEFGVEISDLLRWQ